MPRLVAGWLVILLPAIIVGSALSVTCFATCNRTVVNALLSEEVFDQTFSVGLTANPTIETAAEHFSGMLQAQTPTAEIWLAALIQLLLHTTVLFLLFALLAARKPQSFLERGNSMVWITYIGKRFLRNVGSGLALFIVPLMLVVLLSWLSGVTEQQKRQLSALYEVPIPCEVTDLHGNTERPITNNYIYILTSPGRALTPYVKDVLCRRTLNFEWKGKTLDLVGITAWAASDAFIMGSEKNIESSPGYDESTLQSNDRVVWVNRVWLSQNQLAWATRLL